jgi:ComEC/Rec2-related protein
MKSWIVPIVCWAYILGLASTGLAWDGFDHPIPLASYGVLGLGILCGVIVPRYWRTGPTRRQWFVVGIIGFLGALYCLWKIPEPGSQDVSNWIHSVEGNEVLTGKLEGFPQKVRGDRYRFWLNVDTVKDRFHEVAQPANGKVYITTGSNAKQGLLSQVKTFYPGISVEVKGKLTEPETSKKRGEFNLKAYLAKQDCFTTAKIVFARALPEQTKPKWRLWRLRERIVKAQGRWLNDEQGALLSAIAMGKQAVDLPFTLRDEFITAGLAHTLAASGCQVSLILGIVLGLLRSQLPHIQASAGAAALAMFVGLAGMEASIMRAVVMGLGVLIGLALRRQVNPMGCLFMAVVVLLLWQPQWIWDVGFQLSVMATFGLMVMTLGIVQRLKWLPVAIATIIAVPIAAYVWTIPLQLHYFGVIPPYSIGLNIISTPLVSLLSLGGFSSAIAGAIWPWIGSAIAWLMSIPLNLLIGLVQLFNHLPGHQIQIPPLPAWLVLLSYSFYGSIWWAMQKPSKAT